MNDASPNLLKMIEILSTKATSLQDLHKILGKSVKQIKRNLEKLKEQGYSVEQDFQNRYFIFGADNLRNRLFDETEQAFLHSLVSLHAPEHALAAAILLKLKPEPIHIPVVPQIKSGLMTRNFELISEALKHNKRVLLKRYLSISGVVSVKDRILEPLYFEDHHRQMKAWEISSRMAKSFKLDRMEQVEILDESCKNRQLKPMFTDAFSFSSVKPRMVKLQLSIRARELLSEDHPEAIPYIIEKEGKWYFHGPVSHPMGIGRFILGLPGEIVIIYGTELIGYLRVMKEKYSF